MMMLILLLLLPGILAEDETVPFKLRVQNSIDHLEPEMYNAHTVPGGILLGAMKNLRGSCSKFCFTYKDDPNYGPWLQSVNGVAGNKEKHTYWEILVKKQKGTIEPTSVGIGCYIPKANEEVILNFTQYETSGSCRFPKWTLESAEGH